MCAKECAKTNYRIERLTVKLIHYHGKGVSWCEQWNRASSLWWIKSSVTGGTMVSSKNCVFCNFCDLSKNSEKLKKSQFLLKLIKSSGTGGRRVSSKNWNFSKNCEKLEKLQFLIKLITTSVRGGRRVPSKKLGFLQFLQKLQKIEEIPVFAKIN